MKLTNDQNDSISELTKEEKSVSKTSYGAKSSIKPWDNQEEQLRAAFNPQITFVFNPESGQQKHEIILEDPEESPQPQKMPIEFDPFTDSVDGKKII